MLAVPMGRLRAVRIPLRLNILLVFMAVLVPLCIAVIGYNYFATRALAINTIRQRVTDISDRIAERQQRYLLPATSLADIYANRFGEAGIRATDDPGFPQGVLQAMALFPQLYAVYVGYDNGDFVHVVKFSKEELAKAAELHIPPVARYAVRKLLAGGKKPGDTWVFLDEHRQPIFEERRPITFDPRGRPWFYAAVRATGVVASAPYKFVASQQMGITFSKKLTGRANGVVGVDLTTSDLSAFLTRIRIGDAGHILVFGEDGSLVAFTQGLRESATPARGTGALDMPAAEDLIAMFLRMMTAQDRDQIQATIHGVDYLVDMRKLQLGEHLGFRVVVLAPVGEFFAPIARISQSTVIISGVIGLLAVPLILLLAARVAKPILRLAEDARNIQHMQLKPMPGFRTAVSEVHDLADSFTAMKSTLNKFTKFVPRAVVRELMETEGEPVPGGEKRNISILFTDVQDFTRLSEGMPPADLLRKATTYYHEVGTVILQSEGQIGRFMGDGIIAYWNAPQDDPEHALHAATAVLHSRANSEALNRKWESFGWPIMHTRFGLHIGDAIVGNIGLPDRMDYSAFGDSLNIASRLEGLNKFYGTQILVSSIMADQLRDKFTMRWVDRVAPKGTTLPMEILELVGTNGEGDDFVRASPQHVRMTEMWNERVASAYLKQNWDSALAGIAEYQQVFPNDPLSRIYVSRCTEFRAAPPPAAWDGVVRYSEK